MHRNVANVVAHGDLNCLSVIQFAADVLQVKHIIVVGHSRCGGVAAALEGRRVGLADNWLRYVQDVRNRHADLAGRRSTRRGASTRSASSTSSSRRATSARPRSCATPGRAARSWSCTAGSTACSNGLLNDLRFTVDQPRRRGGRLRRGGRRGCSSATRRRMSAAERGAAPAFPAALTDARAFAIAKAMLEGFDRHYRLFRQASTEAKARFEAADWHGQQRAQALRIEYYDKRVDEAAERLQREFEAAALPMDVWQQVKLHYIGLLIDHNQPELAETFFNSVTTKILHRSYFRNDFIFVRPAVSTEYIENNEPAAQPTYRAYYPTAETLRGDLAADRRQLPAGARVRGPGARRRLGDAGGERAARRAAACAPTSRSRCCRRCSSATRAPTSSARSSTASPRRRSPCRSSTPARRQADDRRRPVRRGRPAARLQLRPRLLHGGDGGALGLRAVPALADAEEAALRDLQRDRPAEAGQEHLLPRLPDAHPALVGQVPHRPRHQGHGDAGVRPAELSVRVQGDQGLLSGAEGHDAREDQGQVPAGQAARPGRPHGRHARVQQRRLPARALRARADRRAAPSSARACSRRTARRW